MGTSSNRLIVAMLIVVVLAGGFWLVALSPKREKASRLEKVVEREQAALAEDQRALAVAEEARADFSDDYRKLVVLGKAVPGDDDTASLIVELNAISKGADLRFQEFALDEGGDGESEPTGASPEEPAPPTEVAAALLPLGAKIGPAGLATMRYKLTFTGRFFHVADFIAGIDDLVDSKKVGVLVDGRLTTINGFALTSSAERPFPYLEATFSLTSFVTPPTEGITGGATAVGPLTTGTPAAAITEGTP